MTDIDELRTHIESLIARLREEKFPDPDDFQVRWIEDRDQALTINDPRAPLELHLPVVNSALDYATCLHEIGHILGEDQSDIAVLIRERRAWDWARQNALFWSPEIEQDAQASIAWYEEEIRAGRLEERRAP